MTGISRRLFLGAGLGVAAIVAAGAAGAELVDHGVLPGKSALDAIDGACDVPSAELDGYAPPGPSLSGSFHSAARNRAVGYIIGYPPGHRPGDDLPLVIMLHGEGGDHANALAGKAATTARSSPSRNRRLWPSWPSAWPRPWRRASGGLSAAAR